MKISILESHAYDATSVNAKASLWKLKLTHYPLRRHHSGGDLVDQKSCFGD